MTQVKFIESTSSSSLEKSVNEFLKEIATGYLIRDIKYIVCERGHGMARYNAMVIYEMR